MTVLRDGEFVATRQVAETSEPELITMMVGRVIDHLFPKLATKVGAPVLEVRDLVSPPVVRGVSFTVRAGEIVGLAGLIGSGRSEVAQTVFGISPATSGEIRLAGKPVRITSAGQAKRHGIAYVPEDRGTPGRDPGDDPAPERVPGGPAPDRAARASSTATPRRSWPPTPSPASRSAPAGPSRSWASCRAATSRRSSSASGWRPSPGC